jgi:hypothetical protein
MRRLLLAFSLVAGGVYGCSGAADSGFGDGSDDGGGDDGGGGSGADGGPGVGSDGSGTNGGGPSVIYAHTDTELYTMDPSNHLVTDVGPFQVGGSPPGGAVTDLAVNASGDVYVNTETAVYKAKVPTSPGPIALTLQTSIIGQGKFYALGFTPPGVLGSAEGLVGGDSNGELWYIDTSTANATPQDLGGFGQDSTGNPWELSGDVVFYTQDGAPTGLATIRTCTGGAHGSCDHSNDSLAAIDMTALSQAFSTKTARSLLKGTYGTGTGYGDLFGLGAWGNVAYAFSREQSGGTLAQLVQIDGTTGKGTSLQQFGSITSGWSGAGVTTKAVINVPPPVK